MYSLIFAVIVSLFCYCGNNYTIFNTFYYDEPTPKTYQATALKYKSEKVNNNKQLEFLKKYLCKLNIDDNTRHF